MKITIEKAALKIDISDLVNHMDEEARKIFYQEIVFEEKLLEACMDFLVSDYAFEDCYHTTCYGAVMERLGDKLKAKCLPLMDKAAQELIKNLQYDVKSYAADAEKWRNHAWKLEREWPQLRTYDDCPVDPYVLHRNQIKKLPECPRLK